MPGSRTLVDDTACNGPATQRPSMIHNGNQSRVARVTEKNQYDIENASTCTPTQLASPHIVVVRGPVGPFGDFLARRLTTMHQMVTPTPTAIEIISPRNTAAHQG